MVPLHRNGFFCRAQVSIRKACRKNSCASTRLCCSRKMFPRPRLRNEYHMYTMCLCLCILCDNYIWYIHYIYIYMYIYVDDICVYNYIHVVYIDVWIRTNTHITGLILITSRSQLGLYDTVSPCCWFINVNGLLVNMFKRPKHFRAFDVSGSW